MYLERSVRIPAEFAVKREKQETDRGRVKEKQTEEKTERETGDTEREINTTEGCDVTRCLLLLFWQRGAASL